MGGHVLVSEFWESWFVQHPLSMSKDETHVCALIMRKIIGRIHMCKMLALHASISKLYSVDVKLLSLCSEEMHYDFLERVHDILPL